MSHIYNSIYQAAIGGTRILGVVCCGISLHIKGVRGNATKIRELQLRIKVQYCKHSTGVLHCFLYPHSQTLMHLTHLV